MLTFKVMLSCFYLLALSVFEARPEAASRFLEREVIYPVSFGKNRRYMRFRETPVRPPIDPNNRLDYLTAASRPPSLSSESLPAYSHPETELSESEFGDAHSRRNHSQPASVKGRPRKRARDPNSSSKPKSEPKTPVDRADKEDDSFSLRNFLSRYIPTPIRSLLRSESQDEVESKKVRKGPRPGMHRFRPQGLRSAAQNEDNIPEHDSIPTWHSLGHDVPEHGQPLSFSQVDSELSYESPSSFHPLQREVSFSSPLSFHPAERDVSYTRSSAFPSTQRETLYSSPYSFHSAEREVSYHRPSYFPSEKGLISYSSSHSFPPIEREISHSSLMNFPTLQEELPYSRPHSFPPENREISYSSRHPFPPIQRETPYSGLHSYHPLEKTITYSSYPSYPPPRKEITYSSYPSYPLAQKEMTYSSYPSYPPVPRDVSYSSLKSFPSVQKEISHPKYLDPEFSLGFDQDIYSDIPRPYSKIFETMHDHYPPSYTYSKPLSEGYSTLPMSPIYAPVKRSSRIQPDNSNQIDPYYESMPKLYKPSSNERETEMLHRPYSLRFVTPPPVYGTVRYVFRHSGDFTGHHMKSFGNSTAVVLPHSLNHPSSHLPLHPSSHVPTHSTSHHPPQTVLHTPMHPPSNPPPRPPPHSAPHSSPHPPFNPPSHNPPLEDRVTGESIRRLDSASPISFPGGPPDINAAKDSANPITFPGGSPDVGATEDELNISAATGNGICDLKNGQTMYAGTCELLLSQSTCLENHWLVLLKTGIPACAYRRCPHGMIYYEGSCVDPGDETVCGVGQMLYVHLTGEAECDCDPKHVYDPSSKRCYGEHEQGFCRDSYYIELRDNKAACVANPCHQEGFVMHDGRCYQKEYDGVCPSPQIMFHPEPGTAECVEMVTKSIFGVRIQTACPTGSKRSYQRTCRTVFRMPSQRTFPKQRGACPSSFTGGSRNSCRQTVGLFG